MKTKSISQNRLHFLDAIRGVCIVGMVVYHALVDVIMLFNITLPQGVIFTVNIIRDFGASCFIFISGMCFVFGRHRIKRFIILNAAGLLVTAVTYFVMPESFVIFGILTFMGISGGIAALLKPLLQRINPVIGLIASFLLFLVFFNCYYGYIGFYNNVFCYFPAALYKNIFTAFLGFPYNGFVSGDYYPLLPWIFMYLFGYFCSRAVYAKQGITDSLKRNVPFFSSVGRYSLYIYLAHQPVVYGALYLASLIFNK